MRSLAISSRSTPRRPTARCASTGARVTLAALAVTALFGAAPAAGAPPGAGPTVCNGWQWVGISSACTGGNGWNAAPLFNPPIPGAPAYCVYAWSGPIEPTFADLTNLNGLGAADLTG